MDHSQGHYSQHTLNSAERSLYPFRPAISPSPMKRTATALNGTTSSSRRHAELARSGNGPASARASGNSRESIINMRQEIMESLKRSPTKLYDEDLNAQRLNGDTNGNSSFHSRPTSQANDERQSSSISTYARQNPTPEAKVLGDYYDDIFDTVDNGAHQLKRNGRDTMNSQEVPDQSHHAAMGEEDEDDDDKLNIHFNNHSSISNRISGTDIKTNGIRRIPPTKRVLSRPTSPEKKQSQISRLPHGQQNHKKPKNSPPSLLRPPSFQSEKIKTANAVPTTEAFKSNQNRRAPPRAAHSALPRQAINSQLPQPSSKQQAEDLDEDLLDMGSYVPQEAQANGDRDISKARKSNFTTDSDSASGIMHDDVRDNDNDVEEIEVRHEASHKKEEVSLIDSSFLKTSKLESTDIAKLRATYATEVASLKAQLAGKEIELNAMKSSMESSEKKAFECERSLIEKLDKVAKELHVQYSKKHEAKIHALKKQHEAMLNARVRELEQSLSDVTTLLDQERLEKDELVKTCDMYLEMEEMRAREEEQRLASQSHRGR